MSVVFGGGLWGNRFSPVLWVLGIEPLLLGLTQLGLLNGPQVGMFLAWNVGRHFCLESSTWKNVEEILDSPLASCFSVRVASFSIGRH